jgi:hypothetical protein
VHWNGTIGRYRQNKEELLEVGPVIFVVPVGGPKSRLPLEEMALSLSVFACEGQGGRVVVKLIHVDLEIPQSPQDEFGHEGSAIGGKETVQGAADTVIIEQIGLTWLETQQRRLHLTSPFDVCVDGLAVVKGDVPEKDTECQGVVETATFGKRLGKEPVEAETIQDGIEERQAGKAVGFQV